MGNFTLKTDSYLNQFALFKGINKLLDKYEDTPEDRIPSLSQLIANKLYNEWLDLANIISDLNNWTKNDWDNFNIGMSLAESCKNRIDSISYALQGLGWKFIEGNNNEMTITPSGTTIKINVDHIDTPPRLDQIKSKLKRCIEYLILTKDPDIKFNIDKVNMLVELSSDSTFNDVISNKLGVLLEADVTQISVLITIHVFDSATGAEVSDIVSYEYPDSTHPSGYTKYDVKIKDEESGTFITDPSLYYIRALYRIGASNIRIDSVVIDDTGWVEDDPPYPGTSRSYSKSFKSIAATLNPDKDVTINLTPSSIEDEYKIAESELFLSEVNNGIVTLTCTHIPLGNISIKLMSYYTDEYEDEVYKFNATLIASKWDHDTNTITINNPGISDVNDLIVSSRIYDKHEFDICNKFGIRVKSVNEGSITFECTPWVEYIDNELPIVHYPDTNVVIPMELFSIISEESTVPPNVSESNPIPSIYFDRDKMILWVAKGQGFMDHNLIDAIFEARHIYGGDLTKYEIGITWEVLP